MGGGGVLVIVFAPEESLVTRCSVLRYPGSFLPAGIETREKQVAGAAGERYRRIALDAGAIAGREGRRLEYEVGAGRTVEWAFEDGGDFVIFQLAAPAEVWDDEARRAELEAVRDSFRWTGGRVRGPVDATPPAEIRALRAGGGAVARPFEVTKHTIAARVEPGEHDLAVTDSIELVSREEGLGEVRLYTSVMAVEEVRSETPLSWRTELSLIHI